MTNEEAKAYAVIALQNLFLNDCIKVENTGKLLKAMSLEMDYVMSFRTGAIETVKILLGDKKKR